MKTFFSVFLSFLILSCVQREELQEPDTLPQITEIGANTAGVIVDGMVIIPKDGINKSYGGPEIIKGLSVILGTDFIGSNGNDSFSLSIKNVPLKNGFIFFMDIGILNHTGDYFTDDQPKWPQIFVGKIFDGISVKQFFAKKNSCKVTITKLDFKKELFQGLFSGMYLTKRIIKLPSKKADLT